MDSSIAAGAATIDIATLMALILSAVSAIAAIAAVIASLHVHYKDGLPSLVVYLYHNRDQGTTELVLANVGKGVARNVQIRGLDESFVQTSLLKSVNRSFAFRGVSCLAPGVELRTVVVAGTQGVKECEGKRCEVTLTYEEAGFMRKSRKSECPFSLGYEDLAHSVYAISDLHRIRQELEKERKAAEKMLAVEKRIAASLENLVDSASEQDV